MPRENGLREDILKLSQKAKNNGETEIAFALSMLGLSIDNEVMDSHADFIMDSLYEVVADIGGALQYTDVDLENIENFLHEYCSECDSKNDCYIRDGIDGV